MEKSENKVPTPLENQLIEANKDKEMYRSLYYDCNKKYERLTGILKAIGVLIVNLEGK